MTIDFLQPNICFSIKHSELKGKKSIKYKDRAEHSATLHLMCFISTYSPLFIWNVYYSISTFVRIKWKSLSISIHMVWHSINRRLTKGVPFILSYCLGDVEGEIFGYCSRGVVILNVGTSCNGPCTGKRTKKQNKAKKQHIFSLQKQIKHWLMITQIHAEQDWMESYNTIPLDLARELLFAVIKQIARN